MEATNMIPEIRKNCKYAAACVTSMGVRITPENRMAVHNSDLFYLQATSAESNVQPGRTRVEGTLQTLPSTVMWQWVTS